MNATLTLRAAAPLDARGVAEILGAFARDTPWMPRLHSAAEDLAHADAMIAQGWVTLAESAGIDGFLARDGAEIHALYIRREVRGRGIGTRLLETAKSRTDRLALWTFAQNHGARRFYARHGFAETARTAGENEEGLPDIRLVWQRERTR